MLNILFVSEENGHLNVGLEDLVEEPLDAGEDKSSDEKDVRKVEGELA